MNKIVCIIVLYNFDLSRAWGSEAHQIAAKISMSMLSKNGINLVSSLLTVPGETLDESFYKASVWADGVQNTESYAWSRPLHFTNLPDRVCDGFNFKRDCTNGMCTVSAIVNYTDRVGDIHLSPEQRIEALKFLIHFVADVTQPLHVGFTSDHGGNKITVRPPWDHKFNKAGKAIPSPRPKPLHVLWDSHILQYILFKKGMTWDQWAEAIIWSIGAKDVEKHLLRVTPIAYASQAASDTSYLSCSYAYKADGNWIKSGDALKKDYYENSARIIEQQLIRAGQDIAAVINKIARDINDRMDYSSTDDESDMSEFEDFWENAAFSGDYEYDALLFP